jgi:hypothetical protein
MYYSVMNFHIPCEGSGKNFYTVIGKKSTLTGSADVYKQLDLYSL